MNQSEPGKLLRIFIDESDKHKGTPLYEWIVIHAKENGLSGATVLRGLEGFGAHHDIHTSKILRLSDKLPIVVEIIDTNDKIEAFVTKIETVIQEGLVTLEDVQFRLYRKTDES